MAGLAKSDANPDGFDAVQLGSAFKEAEAHVLRRDIIENGRRVDGRNLTTVRPIVSAKWACCPRTHGSALFTRGETQALVVATLGTGDDEQWIDALEGTYKEHFLLHYNFPPYSVGETGRVGSPKRREIGHGKLAWRALRPMLPVQGKSSPTPCVWSRRSPSPMVRRPWPRSAAAPWR